MNRFYKKYHQRPSKFKFGSSKLISTPNSLFQNWSARNRSNNNEVTVLIASPTASESSQSVRDTNLENDSDEDDLSDID